MSYSRSKRQLNDEEREYLINEHFSDLKKRNKKELEDFFDSYSVWIFHCKAEKCIMLPEEINEGDSYLFQTDSNQILWFGMERDFKRRNKDKYEKFPNSEFEIVSVFNSNVELVFQEIHIFGNKLEPLRKITGNEKKQLLRKSGIVKPPPRDIRDDEMQHFGLIDTQIPDEESLLILKSEQENIAIIKGNLEEIASQSAKPQRYLTEKIKEDKVTFVCTTCQESYKFDSKYFSNNPLEHIEGLSKTDQVVRRTPFNIFSPFLAIIIAVFVFIKVHRALYGPIIAIGIPLLIPSFAAVITYYIGKFLFSGMFASRKDIPIYSFECRKCHSEVLFATDGKKTALPVSSSKSKPAPEKK